jgi:hypothetical protein
MKRLLLFLGSSLLLASSAQAQLSVRVGGNLSHLTTSALRNRLGSPNTTGSSFDNRLGYQAGVLYVAQLSTRFALVPEVQLRRENAHVSAYDYTYIDSFQNWDYQLRQSYLSVPVLVRANLGPVYVEVGPQASVLLQARQVGTVVTNGWGSSTLDIDHAVTGNYHRFDVGPCVGVGLKLPASLGLSVRAYQGLLNLGQEQPLITPYQTPNSFNLTTIQHRQSLEASLTYQLTARQ